MPGGQGPCWSSQCQWQYAHCLILCLGKGWLLTRNWWMCEWINCSQNLDVGGKVIKMWRQITANHGVIPTALRPQALCQHHGYTSWHWHSGFWAGKVSWLQGTGCLKKEMLVTYGEIVFKRSRKEAKDSAMFCWFSHRRLWWPWQEQFQRIGNQKLTAGELVGVEEVETVNINDYFQIVEQEWEEKWH